MIPGWIKIAKEYTEQVEERTSKTDGEKTTRTSKNVKRKVAQQHRIKNNAHKL